MIRTEHQRTGWAELQPPRRRGRAPAVRALGRRPPQDADRKLLRPPSTARPSSAKPSPSLPLPLPTLAWPSSAPPPAARPLSCAAEPPERPQPPDFKPHRPHPLLDDQDIYQPGQRRGPTARGCVGMVYAVPVPLPSFISIAYNIAYRSAPGRRGRPQRTDAIRLVETLRSATPSSGTRSQDRLAELANQPLRRPAATRLHRPRPAQPKVLLPRRTLLRPRPDFHRQNLRQLRCSPFKEKYSIGPCNH